MSVRTRIRGWVRRFRTPAAMPPQQPWPPQSQAFGHIGETYQWAQHAPARPTVSTAAPSADPYFPFTVELDIQFRAAARSASPHDPFLVARHLLGQRVAHLSSDYALTQRDELRATLERALAAPITDDATNVLAWAHCTNVYADEEHVEIIRRKEQARRNLAANRWHRSERDDEIEYFDAILTDPRKATAWWFSRNLDAPEQLPGIAETFSALARQFRPLVEHDSPGTVLDDFISVAEAGTSGYFLHCFASLLEDCGHGEMLARLRAAASIRGGRSDE